MLGALLVVGAYYARQALRGTASLDNTDAQPAPLPAPSIEAAAVEMPPRTLTPADRAFLASLRADYGLRLDQPRAQLQLLEDLAAYVAARDPRAGDRAVARLLHELDPARAGVLLDRHRQLEAYSRWLDARRDALRVLPPEQRRAALWQARRDAFGSDADTIWYAELRQVVPVGAAIAAP